MKRDGTFSVGNKDGPWIKGHPTVMKNGAIYYGFGKYFVHRLMAATFCKNPVPSVLIQVDHINGDSSDNRASNLRWLTPQLNRMNVSARCAYRKTRMAIYDRGGRKRWVKCKPYWQSLVVTLGERNFLGDFSTEAEACARSRAFREERFREIYLDILKAHDIGESEACSCDIQPLRQPPSSSTDLDNDSRDCGSSEGRSQKLLVGDSHPAIHPVATSSQKKGAVKLKLVNGPQPKRTNSNCRHSDRRASFCSAG